MKVGMTRKNDETSNLNFRKQETENSKISGLSDIKLSDVTLSPDTIVNYIYVDTCKVYIS